MIVVFYDGDCGLCQRLIQFLLKADKKKILNFAPLGGKNYRRIYGDEQRSFTTLILNYDGKTFEKSSAVLKLCLLLGGAYKLLYFFVIVPGFIRDALYDFIAFRRKRICKLSPGDITSDARFLD